MDPRGTYHDVIERNKIWFGFAVDFFDPNVNDNLNMETKNIVIKIKDQTDDIITMLFNDDSRACCIDKVSVALAATGHLKHSAST